MCGTILVTFILIPGKAFRNYDYNGTDDWKSQDIKLSERYLKIVLSSAGLLWMLWLWHYHKAISGDN